MRVRSSDDLVWPHFNEKRNVSVTIIDLYASREFGTILRIPRPALMAAFEAVRLGLSLRPQLRCYIMH